MSDPTIPATDIVAQATPAPKLSWRMVRDANESMGYGPEMGLFRDGIRVASYHTNKHGVWVYEHPHGQDRCARTFTVSSVTVARRVCRQLAEGTYPAAPATGGQP